jgi:hypothetical protein
MKAEERPGQKADLFTCDRCGKPWAYRTRQDAVKAFHDPEYKKKLGMCLCDDDEEG